MLGGGSDGAHNAPDSRRKTGHFPAICRKRASPVAPRVYRETAVTRRVARAAACRHRRRHRSSGDGDSPAEPAARSSTARPPSTSSGTGTEDGPDVSVGGTTVAVVSVSVVVGLVGGVRSCRCRPSSSWFRARPRGGRLGRPGRARRGVAAARVGLALLRERERAADLFLRVRVVENVGRKLRDRLGVAVERVDLADAAVVVPVGDHLVGAGLRLRHGRLAAHRRHHHECDEQETEAQGAVKGEGSNHDTERAGGASVPEGVWQVSRLPLSRW